MALQPTLACAFLTVLPLFAKALRRCPPKSTAISLQEHCNRSAITVQSASDCSALADAFAKSLIASVLPWQ